MEFSKKELELIKAAVMVARGRAVIHYAELINSGHKGRRLEWAAKAVDSYAELYDKVAEHIESVCE